MPGIPFHIIQRGNNRSACFYSGRDYIFYIETLAVLAQLYGCKVHALCLMTNHVHLLLTPTCCAGAGLLMKGVGSEMFSTPIEHINEQEHCGKAVSALVWFNKTTMF
ncbi:MULTISPECIES: transposase [unclassified Pseudomonas]|uniref:transposase n=1 Tax=unclassified Pseudomonas TaxID=196821 RepID=UPI002113B31B|nr:MULTISPECIES: transposase [unclassified Pseudomonas]